MYKCILDLNYSRLRVRGSKSSREGKKVGKRTESKDKSKEEKYKEDKEYERKIRRLTMLVRLEKYRGEFYRLEVRCRR